MDLIVIFGTGAVGKMTVGQELTKITDFRLFHNHLMIEPVIEVMGYFDGPLVQRLREETFDAFIRSRNKGLIFTFMWALDIKEDWDYIAHVAEKFEASGGTVYYVELVADQAVRLQRNKTENRLQNKPSKRDTMLSDERMIREETKYRLVSREGEMPFEHYLKIDNTNLEPDQVAKIIKEHFSFPDKTREELFSRIILEEVREDEIEQLYAMQVESFLPLYEKYHDDCSPAIESIDRVKGRFIRPNRKYYFIAKDGARVGAINIGHNDPNEKKVAFISPLFVRPLYQNQGIGYVAIQKAFDLLPEVTTWKLETILQEKGNCHLYEKCGFVRVGEEKPVNEVMTLIDYVYDK